MVFVASTRTSRKDGGRNAPIVEQTTVARELLVQWSPPRIDDQIIRELYMTQGLNTRDTAQKLGVSKTCVVKRLRKMGIRRKVGGLNA